MANTLYLPAPSRTITTTIVQRQQNPRSNVVQKRTRNAPSYEERCSIATNPSSKTKPFCPRSVRDFDDGGAFPEIHVAQYPRHMGNPHLAKKKSTGKNPEGLLTTQSIVNVEIGPDGEVNYDAVVKGGTNSNKLVYSRHEDLKGGEPDPDDVRLPSAEEEAKAFERTSAALQTLVSSKVAMAKPTGSAIVNAATSHNVESKTQFIKYTPREDAPGYNPLAKHRVIQMVPAQIDPMAPPKHMHKKAPRGPADDPIPVLHAPPKKLSKEERDKWNIPACISNWKNTRGYTIPLDKRLAADGRGLRDHTINSNFATLSESLYVAERQAREEVRMRSMVQKKLATAEKERREQELRELANKARLERTQHPPSASSQITPASSSNNSNRAAQSHAPEPDEPPRISDDEGAHQRDRLRIARKKERERELRLENLKGNAKKQRLEDERDVSEKVALGIHTGAALGGQLDSRLYNQSAGMDSGFGREDEYNTYSKPLFDRDNVAKSIYKPSASAMEDAGEEYEKLRKGAGTKFVPDRGFAGAEGVGQARKAPVQFEKR